MPSCHVSLLSDWVILPLMESRLQDGPSPVRNDRSRQLKRTPRIEYQNALQRGNRFCQQVRLAQLQPKAGFGRGERLRRGIVNLAAFEREKHGAMNL